MGIRFYCPNGHKLNVKSFLAGKRGVCPRCDARFRIPLESQISSEAPRMRPEGVNGAANGADGPPPPATSAVESQVAVELSGSDDAVWYVRPPTGGQYGPAREPMFRDWVDQGRVAADSLIWREGWSDWRPAGAVLPDLARIPGLAAGGNSPDAASPAQAGLGGRRRHSPTKPKSIAAVVILGLSTVALLVVLVIVLQTK